MLLCASRVEDPGFESRLRRDFFRIESYQWLKKKKKKNGTPVATLPGAWRYRVSPGTGRPGVSILWLGKVESLICSFYLSVAVRKIVRAVCWLVGCLSSQQHASVSQGRICSDNFTCCHTEIEVSDPTFHLTHSQYTDTGPTSPSTDPITPGAWQGSHWSASF